MNNNWKELLCARSTGHSLFETRRGWIGLECESGRVMLGWYVLGWSMDGFGICWDGRACSWIDGSVGLNRLDPNGGERIGLDRILHIVTNWV